jgi:hypothetical protein
MTRPGRLESRDDLLPLLTGMCNGEEAKLEETADSRLRATSDLDEIVY